MKTKRRIENVIIYIVFIAVAVITLFPVFYAMMQSFRTNMEIMASPEVIIPENPTWDNYRTIMSSRDFYLPRLLLNSVLYSASIVLTNVFASSMSAYVFSRGHFRGKTLIFMCFSSLMFIKMGGVSIYATFKVIKFLNLPISLWTLIGQSLFSIPVVYIYLMMGYIKSLPSELDEAAKMDGASFFGIYYRIILPLMKPVLATVAILSFKASWNDYVQPMIYTASRPDQRTLIVALMSLKNSSGAATSWHILFAGAVVTMIPILIVYLCLNKYFVSGLTAGAVKG